MARLILIADDSPIIQRKAQRILEDEGFEVQTVSNGVAAVKKLPGMQPALVLADVSMPGKDGYEVCEFVKTSAGLRHVPVLLVGSDLEPYDEQRGTRVRADGIIKKPFASHDLIAMVRRFAVPTKAPASLSTPVETPVAASPTPVQAIPTESPAAPAPPTALEGREAEIPPADAAAPINVAEDAVSNGGRQFYEHPEPTPGSLPEPSPAPGEPFPGLVLGAAPESGSELSSEGKPVRAFTAPKGSLEAEEPRPEEIGEFILPPQLVDLTATENVAEPNPVFAEPLPEPEFAPPLDLTAAEMVREVEEWNAQEPEELGSSPQLVDLRTPEAVPEPASPTAQPIPETMPEPVVAGAETTRAVEELNPTPQTLEPSSSSAPAPEPAPVVTEPAPEPLPDAAPQPASASPEAGQEWGDLISTPPAVETSAPVDSEWVYKVVHKVVARMAPPVLAPEQVEELARLLTLEIMADFDGPGGQTDIAPELLPPDGE